MKTKTKNPVLNCAASMARKMASVDSRGVCFVVHQPKAPVNMEARLKAMTKKTQQ